MRGFRWILPKAYVSPVHYSENSRSGAPEKRRTSQSGAPVQNIIKFSFSPHKSLSKSGAVGVLKSLEIQNISLAAPLQSLCRTFRQKVKNEVV